MNFFRDMGFAPTIIESLERMQCTNPTPVQAQAIPLAMQGHDVLATAQTGTGKTLGFVLPLVAHLQNNPQASALVLTPTRELAYQVNKTVQQVLGYTATKMPRAPREHRGRNRGPVEQEFAPSTKDGISTALLIGGDPYFKQLAQLKAQARIVVGTPGRIIDHVKRKSLNLKNFSFLVLDESDQMLDMGFDVQLAQIAKFLPHDRQTLMFSATFPGEIEKLASAYLKEPKRVSIQSKTTTVSLLKQETIKLKEWEKRETLVTQLNQREGSIIVFVRTRQDAESLARHLHENEQNVIAIHGDMRQSKRKEATDKFRNGRFRVIVATDVFARGIHVDNVAHVINFDLPDSPEVFVHRIGRTARAGKEGNALSFVTPKDARKWGAIQRLLNPNDKSFEQSERSFGKKEGGFRPRGFGSSRGSGERSRSFGDSRGPSERSRPFADSKGSNERSRSFGESRSRSERPRPFGDSRSSDERQSPRGRNKFSFDKPDNFVPPRSGRKSRNGQERDFEGAKDFYSGRSRNQGR